MSDHGSSSAAAPAEPPQTSEPASGSIDQSPQPSPLSQESADHFAGWEAIGGRQGFYNEQDCIHPSHGLANKKLKDRGENEVVLFDYSLDLDPPGRVDRNPPVEGGSSSGRFSADDDIFSRMLKDALIESRQFDQIINPAREASRGSRLGIIDFPQCYDTYDDNLLNMMGGKLGLRGEGQATFMDAYSQRVRELPGRERFRTGISLRAPFKEPSELSSWGSSEDRFILFVSFPYFGGFSEMTTLGLESESVELPDFKCLGVDVSNQSAVTGRVGEDIGKILVHQARYMIFDNFTMAIFRSKEDRARDRVPLHRFQERVGAFRAVIHMIANLTESEVWTMGKLRASLCKIENDIDKMISDATTYEDNQGMMRVPTDEPPEERLEGGEGLTEEDKVKVKELARKNNVRKRKQERVRDLLTSLNKLSTGLFAAISVAERQIAILQDLHSVFSTSYRTKTKDYQRGYRLRKNPFYKNIIPISILAENPEQIWPATLDTIDEVVRERKCFISGIKELVENMDIRRKILSAFLKSDQAKAAPSEISAQEATEAMRSTEAAIKETKDELVQQGQTLTSFTIVTTAFLPLGFCTSYYGMNNINEFNNAHMSLRDFWLATGPVLVGILLLTVIVIIWKRPALAKLRSGVREKWRQPRENQGKDLESHGSPTSS